MQSIDVERQCLAGVLDRLFQVVTLRMEAGQVRGVHVVPTLVLRLEDKLDLSGLSHAPRIRGRGVASSGVPAVGSGDGGN